MNNVRYVPFAGRLLIGLPFILFGLGKATTYGATVAMIEAVGLPVPPLSFLGAVTLEIVGGALLVAGFKVRPVAALLAIFSMVTAFYFHSNLADQNTFVHFFKNVMMTGGLLQIVGFGAGAFSLDEYLSNRRAYSDRVATAQ
ncbi:DoxX family protein [Kaistia dalseonensis]|uniref:Oxidoreductase n=1 Tax=Kaistia dalseonensis TaxID=410840 RepID=A0ABU0H3N2_9HYPH|nr:DoxX family protein [Kaistia dalseonensis]MCX5493928.1 DoxX family protein [Kaistia dalseonensis]MDQ0436498.1 putative oxidoreductase [Kaistia dalseonensis]